MIRKCSCQTKKSLLKDQEKKNTKATTKGLSDSAYSTF